MKPKERFIMTPIHVVSCVVSAIRQYFGSPERISSDTSKYLWDPDPKLTQVFIAEQFNESVNEALGTRPAILVGAPNGNFPKDVMADQMSFTHNHQSIGYVSRMVGTMPFMCVSEKAMSSLELCTELKYFLGVFRRQIQCSHDIDYLRPTQTQGPIRMEEYKEYWTTSLICDIVYQESWTVFVEGLRLKSLDLALKIT